VTHALVNDISGAFANIPLFAFFETALFRQLPEEEKRYAIPAEYNNRLPIRRYGYHGIYHGYHAGLVKNPGTILSIVLDRQTTVCALEKDKPAYISVGYTPLEGVMGRTTCGDLDPGVAFYLLRDQKQSFYWIDNLLKKESGFKGLTGYDLDIDDLFTHMGGEPPVRKAFEIFFNQILRHAGQALAVSGPLSGVVFGGRYCDALQPVLYRIAKKFSFLGATLKALPWAMDGSKIFMASEKGSKIPVLVSRVPPAEILFESTEKAMQEA
jgi:acetate kinase